MMPTFTGARLPPTPEQQADDRPGQQQLRLRRGPCAVRPAAAMEDLLPSRAQPRRDVLEIGHRRSGGAEHGRIEESASRGQHRERHEAAAELEAAVGDVLVRHSVAGDVERRTQQERERTRPHESSGGAAQRDVEGDDHDRMIAYAPAMSFFTWLRNAIAGPPHIQDGGDPGAAADLEEEYGIPGEGVDDLGRMEGIGGYQAAERFGASEAAEAAEADLASEEAPPDPS